jgi:uncharacterized protein
MITLYFASMDEAAGKSALCSALGISLKAEGERVGFFKPLTALTNEANAGTADRDTEFIKQLLALEEPLDLLCPVSLSTKEFSATANEKDPAWLAKVKEAYLKVSWGKDIVLIEGISGFEAGSAQALAGSLIVKALGAKAILIVRYQSDLKASQIVSAAQALAGHLLGVVINAVPPRRMESVKSTLVPSLEQSGVEVLGTLPEDRALLTISVGELVEHLEGSILNSPQSSENLVESIMVGAMSPDPAVSYLSLKSNKAVITRGDRPDIQLAALTTSTSCLILTGDIKPLPNVLGRAKEINVPIVIVKEGTARTMDAIEGVLDKEKFSHVKKVERLEQLLGQYFNFKPIYQAS